MLLRFPGELPRSHHALLRALLQGATLLYLTYSPALAIADGAAPAPPRPSGAASQVITQPQAEQRLVQILRQIERNELDTALHDVTLLTQEIPNFRAAQLLYADLLRIRAGGVPHGAEFAQQAQQQHSRRKSVADTHLLPTEQYAGLQQELRQRLLAEAAVPPAGMVPQDFLQLSPSVRHAIAVDAKRSRLYLFANSPQGLQLVSHHYITIGRKGVDKRAEGDERTPLGVYFVGRQIPGKQLPDLYGKGALTLNYPNDWDRLQERTGSGIWLHGVPSDEYARLPQASDGCIVLSNEDLVPLMQTIDRRTPVLIRETLQWAPAASAPPTVFLQEIARWQAAWRSNDSQALAQVYDAALQENGVLRQRQQQLAAQMALPQLSAQDVSIYSWNEAAGSVRIVNLRAATTGSGPQGVQLRQYWRQQDGRWLIFAEDVLSS